MGEPTQTPLPFQLSRLATSYWVPQAIHAAAALGVPDVLAAGPRTSVNESMVQLTRHLAAAIAVSYDFGAFRTIVDVGGGYGALLPPILKANPQLRGRVFDLPRCRDGARALAAKTGLADRYDLVAVTSSPIRYRPPTPTSSRASSTTGTTSAASRS